MARYIPMRPDNAISVQVSGFASKEFDAADNSNLGSCAWGVDIACSLLVNKTGGI